MMDLHDKFFMSQVKRIQYCCCSFHYVTKKCMSQPTSKQLLLFGQKSLVFSQSFVLVSPQWAILWRCLTYTVMLRVYSARTSSHKHTHLVLVHHLNSTGEGRNVKLRLIKQIWQKGYKLCFSCVAPHATHRVSSAHAPQCSCTVRLFYSDSPLHETWRNCQREDKKTTT